VYFDPHCHLCDQSYTADLDGVLARAREAGVTDVLVPGISAGSSRSARELASGFAWIHAAAGIHPDSAGTASEDDLTEIRRLLPSAEVIAVGETGIDLHYTDSPPAAAQEALFGKHIEMAEAFGLTLVVHSRDAEERVLRILGADRLFPVVLHCWTGSESDAMEASHRGFYIGFAGPVTYPANGRLRQLAAVLPRDRVLAETDGPYLPPVPLRGRRNEPSFLVHIVDAIASAWGVPVVEAGEILRENSLRALQLGSHRRTDLVYMLNGRIYMNITGQCTNRCRFCIREKSDGLGGYMLRHGAEPDEGRLRRLVGMLDAREHEELVFCGYGEPTMRPGLLRELAAAASDRGFRIRLNTNGLCPAWLSPEETLWMLAPFDTVSVSLNASSPGEYLDLCRPATPGAWENLLGFMRLARTVCRVRATAVRFPGLEMDRVKALSMDLGVEFMERA
jgi:TatD DNase family protein